MVLRFAPFRIEGQREKPRAWFRNLRQCLSFSKRFDLFFAPRTLIPEVASPTEPQPQDSCKAVEKSRHLRGGKLEIAWSSRVLSLSTPVMGFLTFAISGSFLTLDYNLIKLVTFYFHSPDHHAIGIFYIVTWNQKLELRGNSRKGKPDVFRGGIFYQKNKLPKHPELTPVKITIPKQKSQNPLQWVWKFLLHYLSLSRY